MAAQEEELLVPFPTTAAEVAITDQDSAQAVLVLLGGRCHHLRIARDRCRELQQRQPFLSCQREERAAEACAQHVLCPEEFVAFQAHSGAFEDRQLRDCFQRQLDTLQHVLTSSSLGQEPTETPLSRAMKSRCLQAHREYFRCVAPYGRPDVPACEAQLRNLNRCIWPLWVAHIAPEQGPAFEACFLAASASADPTPCLQKLRLMEFLEDPVILGEYQSAMFALHDFSQAESQQ
jgi:hypothetical protein